ncbi:hypothetical protein GCM10017774_00620 [Lentzea cavernae]|uniref:Uncharacterized protein n=1 Tax=Lentzea cavernae TaxID=2020703 RepID=A0ABQ3LX83_9PSEU|nr:hypothetical protein GCM10017774_00620 [Lentzea cavernae]
MRQDEPATTAVVAAVRRGGSRDVAPADDAGSGRTLSHVLTDWPVRCPNGARTVEVLVTAGGDVNARFRGSHREAPLH